MRQRLGQEEGVALAIAMAVMTAVTTLALVVATQSSNTSDYAGKDRNARAALAAAQSGVAIAGYRLHLLQPPTTQCVTTAVVPPNDPSGTCKTVESLGNGASATVYVTPAISGASGCALLPSGSPGSGLDRCVTSTGVVNGISRRVQARLRPPSYAESYPGLGMIGLNSMQVDTNGRFGTTTIGSNGQITLSGSGIVAGPIQWVNPPAPNVGSATTGPVTQNPSPFLPAAIDPANTATVNNNGLLSGTNYTLSAARVLTTGAGGTITMPTGTYNFCQMTLGRDSVVTIPAGAKVTIFIDSPDRAGSGCTGSTGNLSVGQNSSFNNSGNSADLMIKVVGRTLTTSSVNFDQAGLLKAMILAPTASVRFHRNMRFSGWVEGKTLQVDQGFRYTTPTGPGGLTGGSGGGPIQRVAWGDCRPTAPNAADPQSGC